jgi:hypothetical protein
VLLVVLAARRTALFDDPGTPWHYRLGRDIIASASVPRCDTLTYTHLDSPWVDQSWGFDLLLALVVDHAGWTAAGVMTALLLAAVYASLAKGLIGDGISPPVALFATLLALAIGQIHFLLRPHVVTLALVYATIRLCQKQHGQGGWRIAWVPLLTALLANMHGGFLALPVIVVTAAAGHGISGPLDQQRWREVAKFAVAAVASCLASLVNPYGWNLYRHVAGLLVGSGVTSLIQEYQPAPFGTPHAGPFEIVVLSLVALPVLVSRRINRYQLLHVLVWLHLALTSIRNAPLFALVAAPALASLLDGLPLPAELRSLWPRRATRSIWSFALAAGILSLVLSGVQIGGFGAERWPLSAMETLNRQPTAARLFHEQDWGGLIEAKCQPARLSYIDDRFELFGKDAVLEYVQALSGGPSWDTVRERERIDLVWLRPERGLTQRLRDEPGWSELYRDSVSVLFGRKPAGHAELVGPIAAGRS